MDMAVIGAGGSIGRQIVQMIVSERLMDRGERLVLSGNAGGRSAKSLQGFVVDLRDAYAEICPRIDVVFDPEAIRGDLIVMAAGATIPSSPDTDSVDRSSLAQINFPLFDQTAEALGRSGHGSEIVLCVSNPNELAVAAFARHLGRHRVIGMGAFLDSLRFRKEIAQDLGVHRQKIHAFMAGEHGADMVPLWSSVHIYGFTEDRLRSELLRIRKGISTGAFPEHCETVRNELMSLLMSGRIRDAYAFIRQYPPDMRAVLTPFITHLSGSKTVMGTAQATLALIRIIALGNDALITGQIAVEGEFHGIHGTLGVPFVVGNRGVDRIFELPLDPDEKELLLRTAENVRAKLSPFIA